MEDSKDLIDQSAVIFFHAPGANKLVFMAEGIPLHSHSHKVKSVQYANKKANHQEAVELVKKLVEVKLVLKNNQ